MSSELHYLDIILKIHPFWWKEAFFPYPWLVITDYTIQLEPARAISPISCIFKKRAHWADR